MDVLDKRVENIEQKLKTIENGGSQTQAVKRFIFMGMFAIVLSSFMRS
jgi:hypothetical protein